MKLFPFAAWLILATAPASAFAATDSVTPAQTIAANDSFPKTRAQVKAELAAAREPGGELSTNPNQPPYPEQFSTGGYTVPIERFNAARDAPARASSPID
ncbi:hypothetical protein GCM10027093_50310 [Paraburkholderia jirisanensis]